MLWVLMLGAVGFASTLAAELPDDTSAMPGTEAQHAFDLMQQRFPGASGNADRATARVVFGADAGEQVTDAGNRTVIEGLVTDVSQGGQVAGAVSPFQARVVSDDASTAYATVTYTAKSDDLTDATKQHLREAVDRARAAGLTVEVGGPVLAGRPAIGGVSELVGIGLAALVLLITFGSLVGAGLPLVTALVGIGVSMLTIAAVGSVFGLSSTSGTLATMLGLAVGIDYALFVVSRYREERARGHTTEEAVGRAVGTAGSAVVFAGLTVVIAYQAGLVRPRGTRLS